MNRIKTFFASLFSPENLSEIARETRFTVHSVSKLSAADFVRLILGDVGKDRNSSLNHLANQLWQSRKEVISKQGLDKRFSSKSVIFFKTLFGNAIGMQAFTSHPLKEGILDRFNRIRIKDSTRFDLDPSHKDHFAGFGGECASDSGMCVQFEYDLKSQSILEVGLTSANVPDGKNSGDFTVDILRGDLILRDLGYFNLSAIEKIIEKDAYVVTKLNNLVKLYTRSADGGFQVFDYRGVLSGLPKATSEIPVFVGEKTKIPLRLVITRMSEEVRAKRIRNANKDNKKKGYTATGLYKLKAGYNFLLTNIDTEVPDIDICKLYRLRWQVELIFKNFKSEYKIHKAPKIKFERWMTLFYAKLLVIAVDFKLFQYKQIEEYMHYKTLLSVQKVAKTYVGNLQDLLEMIAQGRERINELVWLRLNRLSKGHQLERKKNRTGMGEILLLNI